MRNSSLFELFNTLSTAERADFGLFIRSPWCNDYPHLEAQTQLLNYMAEAAEPDKETAYSSIFPDQPFVDNKMEKLMSATLKSLRRWIVLRLHDSEPEELLELAKFYGTRRLDERFERTIVQARALLEDKTVHEIPDYLLRYLVEYELSTYRTINNLKKDDANFTNTLLALDRFYLVTRLKNTALLQQQSLFLPLEMPAFGKFLPGMLEEMKQHKALQTPLVQLYERVYAMSVGDGLTDTDLTDFLQFMADHTTRLNAETLDVAAVCACNYCTRMYNQSRFEMLPVLFDVLCHRISSGHLYNPERKMRVSDFLLIVHVALRLKKFDWVKSFLEDNKGRLYGIQTPEEAWNFNYARYLFFTGQSDEALDYLSATYEELFYKISAKILELQILYEQDAEILISKLDAAKLFFFREKKITPDKRALYNDFVDMLKQMINPKTLGNRERAGKLIAKVKRLQNIVERDWILEKLETLR